MKTTFIKIQKRHLLSSYLPDLIPLAVTSFRAVHQSFLFAALAIRYYGTYLCRDFGKDQVEVERALVMELVRGLWSV